MAGLRNLILVGGVYHPFEETGPALSRILDAIGWRSEVSVDIEEGLARLGGGEFGQLTFAALRWSMVQHEKYAPFREQWAMSLSEAGRAALRAYSAGGKGILGIHAAPIAFDDWPEWGDLLGLSWRWGISSHPPLAPAEIRMAAASHPITNGLPAFEVADELYTDLDVRPFMHPIVEARHGPGDAWQPVCFAGEWNGARRVYCGLGHDLASLANPAHARLIRRAGQWISRAPVTA